MAQIKDFIAAVNKSGTTKPNFFEVMITFPNKDTSQGRMLAFFCNSAQIPSLPLLTATVTENYIPFEAPYGAQYQDVSLEFYLDQTLTVRKLFEMWYQSVYNHKSRTLEYHDLYTGVVTIQSLDRNLAPTYSVTLSGAYPKNIGQVQFNRNSNDQIATMSVQFAFKELTSDSSTKTLSLNPLTQALGGGLIAGNLSSTINTLVGAQSLITKDVFGSLSGLNKAYVSLTSAMSVLSPADKASVRSSDLSGIIADTRSAINPWSSVKLSSYSSVKIA
jgi:hypothetical protein